MLRRILTIIVLLIILIGGYFAYHKYFSNKTVSASSENIKENKTKYKVTQQKYDDTNQMYTNIPLNKIWEFDFSKSLNENSINSNTVKVTDQENNSVSITPIVSNDGHKIIIYPPKSNYKKNSTYLLQISKDIKYVDGTTVKNGLTINFITVRDEVEKGILRKGIVSIKNDQIKSVNGNTIKLSKTAKKDLKKGDILIIPSNSNLAGKAVKVVTVKNGLFSDTITVEQPHFAELYDKLNIYKTYPIKPENIKIEKGVKGLSVHQLSQPTATSFDTGNTNEPNSAQPISTHAITNLKTVSATNAQVKQSAEEFEPPRIKMDFTNGFEFDFKNVHVPVKNLKIDKYLTLAGNIKIGKPEVNADVDTSYMKINKFQIVSKEQSDCELKVGYGIETLKGGKYEVLKETAEENIKLASVDIPTEIPGLFVTGGFYLEVRWGYSAAPEASISFQFDDERGFFYNGKDTKFINHPSAEFNVGLSGHGEADGESGVAADLGLTAFEVAGGAIEGFGGEEAQGGAYIGTSKEKGNYACFKVTGNPVVEGRVYLDVLENKVLEMIFAKAELPPSLKLGNCEILKKLTVEDSETDIKPGETKKLPLKLDYLDLSEEKESELPIEKTENLHITSSNPSVATASYEDGMLIVLAATNPVTTSATITVDYSEKSDNVFGTDFGKVQTASVEIPVKITDTGLIGNWTRNILNAVGDLNITKSTPTTFNFDLNVAYGGHTGELQGIANINGNKASFTDSDSGCQLSFTLNKDKISIDTQSNQCMNVGGEGTSFTGDYEKGKGNSQTDFVKQKLLTESQDNLFRSVVGNDYNTFLNNMMEVENVTDIDNLNTHVMTGYILGAATTNASIIMINNNYVYAATLTSSSTITSGLVANYYTNDQRYKNKVPKTIQQWVNNYYQTSIVYK